MFGPVGHDDGNLFHRPAPRRTDDVVVRYDVTVGRNDEARTQRLAFTVLRFLLRSAALAEEAFERRACKRVARAGRHFDPLPGRNVHHRRLQLRRQVSETLWGTGARDDTGHMAVVVLRNLGSSRKTGRERDRGAAYQQRTRHGICISHWLHVLFVLFKYLHRLYRRQTYRLTSLTFRRTTVSLAAECRLNGTGIVRRTINADRGTAADTRCPATG